MDPKNYVIGIDLGTSNITLSYSNLETEEIHSFDILQVSSPRLFHEKKYLPASLLLGLSDSEQEEQKKLPWFTEKECDFLLSSTPGSYAKDKSLEASDRVVVSAKSWLCHKHLDPKTPVLPWGSSLPPERKVSAFATIQSFLEHLKLVFDWKNKKDLKEKLSLVDFDLVITVPASFDEDARRLVFEAASACGFKHFSLLEEPQAALYSWIHNYEKTWREEISPGDLILVCDVGGGTSDFSLVCVGDEAGQLSLERVSVGKHLLLGGDNMDHTLAYHLKTKFEAQGTKLDQWQYFSLVNQARSAKEKFFLDSTLEEANLSVASKGSSLIANIKSLKITKQEIEKILADGFFPLSGKEERPTESTEIALHDLGLEYEAETAITKHLAAFLEKSAKNILSSERLKKLLEEAGTHIELDLKEEFIKPKAVLFNGGVFRAKILKDRILQSLRNWGCTDIKELPGNDLDLAVSKGATYYAKLKKSGKGIRIQAGTARSYYLGIESSGIAIPGVPPSLKGLCIVPQGTKEGTSLPEPKKQFGLITGRSVQFRLFSSDERASDFVGQEVDDASLILKELPTMTVSLESKEGKSELVPVTLSSHVNDIGILEISMQQAGNKNKWNLEFNVRKTEH
jgi:hypothetical protein